MSSNIVLGLATRQNLLSLQDINKNISTAQEHLSTGLKVASAVDDAVKFFQSQSLLNRANDISLRKDAIDQGISSLTNATNAAQSVVTVLNQLQGLLNSAKTQSASQRAQTSVQFNILSKQLNNLVNDASYQGLNLLNSTTAALNLQFSIVSTSTLKVTGKNLLVSKLITTAAPGLRRVLATKIVLTKCSTVCALTSKFDAAFMILQSAVFTAQSAAQSLGGNVTF